MFTAEQTQQMNVYVPNVYWWKGTKMNVCVPNVYSWTDATNECRRSKCLLLKRHNKWMSTFHMFTAVQTQHMNVDVPNVPCYTDTTNECWRSKCLLLNRHNKWMSTFQMLTAGDTQHRNVDVPNVYCWRDTTNECRRCKCLLLRWQHMNVDVQNVYCWTDTANECRRSKCLLLRWQQMNVDVLNVYCWTDTTNECRRSKCLLLKRHNKWMSTFQMFTAEETQHMNVDVPNVYCWTDTTNECQMFTTDTTNECRRSKCLLLNRHHKWMSTYQMFTAEQTQQMNVYVPNVYWWKGTKMNVNTTNECRRSKCLLLKRHNKWMSTFQMFTAEETQHMNVDVPNVYCWTDTTNECRRPNVYQNNCLLLNRHNKWMST